MKFRVLLFAFCIIALCSLLVILPLQLLYIPDLPAEIPTERDLPTAITNAVNFLNGSHEPHTLLWLDVIHRRFGITAFADALQRYDQIINERPEQAPMLRVFRRIADYDNPLYVGDLQAVVVDLDLITVPALYSDRLELPNDYPAMLDKAANQGGYLLTHVLLAWIWIQENGCEVSLPDGFIEDLYHDTVAIIDDDPVVDDLELEAAAFLYLAGQGTLVNDSFIERVIAAQNIDGSWGDKSHSWHTTILGLLLLLHVEFPVDSYPPTLAHP